MPHRFRRLRRWPMLVVMAAVTAVVMLAGTITASQQASANTGLVAVPGDLTNFVIAGAPTWYFARANSHDACWPSPAFVGANNDQVPRRRWQTGRTPTRTVSGAVELVDSGPYLTSTTHMSWIAATPASANAPVPRSAARSFNTPKTASKVSAIAATKSHCERRFWATSLTGQAGRAIRSSGDEPDRRSRQDRHPPRRGTPTTGRRRTADSGSRRCASRCTRCRPARRSLLAGG
ncbi:hypothetical protein EV645_8053 [Kribbella rubisoli]|uniref:Uncharacterized protein n=1 Tax=Kribbella rubisoli TaxID=3075929 RepID=A0A4Q7VYU9_9ACTN|nr:hypothetical protein EV645_8053 [Kribbella rubisoli]